MKPDGTDMFGSFVDSRDRIDRLYPLPPTFDSVADGELNDIVSIFCIICYILVSSSIIELGLLCSLKFDISMRTVPYVVLKCRMVSSAIFSLLLAVNSNSSNDLRYIIRLFDLILYTCSLFPSNKVNCRAKTNLMKNYLESKAINGLTNYIHFEYK